MKQIEKIPNWLLILLSVVLYYAIWIPLHWSLLGFIVFLPYLILLNRWAEKGRKSWKVYGTTFLIYLLPALWTNSWISNAHWSGTVASAFFLTLLLSIPFSLFYRYNRKKKVKYGGFVFVLSMVGLEYLQNNWDFTWHWNNLGNALSNFPKLIQFYEFTGYSGGTFWMLATTILIFLWLKGHNRVKIILALVLMNGVFVSLNFQDSVKYDSSDSKLNVIIHQPNYDAYQEKFSTPMVFQIDAFFKDFKSLDTISPQLIVFPETFLKEEINENEIDSNPFINYIQKKLPKNATVLMGANSYHSVNPKTTLDPFTVRNSHSKGFHRKFNTAILFNKEKVFGLYHKSKLVAGVETAPHPELLSVILKGFNVDLGGVSGALGKDAQPKNLSTETFNLSPIICFESTFSEYIGEFTKQGSQLITVITNDDWWGNSAGHKQHLALSKIRAIENNKTIIRSANTGISAIISNKGEIIQFLGYKERGNISGKIALQASPSFYAKNGNLVARISLFVLVLLILQLEVVLIRKIS